MFSLIQGLFMLVLKYLRFSRSFCYCFLIWSHCGQITSDQISRSVVSDSLQPHGLQHTRLLCPLLSPRVCLNSRQPTPVFLPGKPHEQRSLVGYSPWGRKESDKSERLHSLTHVLWVGDAIQPSHLLSPLSSPALNLSQHQGLFQWIASECLQVLA